MAESKTYPKIIVITGAESTGKSELTKQLAMHYNAPFYSEYAREYISNLNRKYNFNDIENIAKKQVEQYNEALASNSEYIFFDTWLIITKVWFEVVSGDCPEWIIEQLQSSKIKGFILNDTDIPWIPDDLRENGGDNREILHRAYLKNLKDFGFNYYLNGGIGETRLKNAINLINNNFS